MSKDLSVIIITHHHTPLHTPDLRRKLYFLKNVTHIHSDTDRHTDVFKFSPVFPFTVKMFLINNEILQERIANKIVYVDNLLYQL